MDKLLTIGFTILPLTIIFALTPYIGRKGSCFGALIYDAVKQKEVQRFKSSYRNAAILLGAASGIGAWFLPDDMLYFVLTLYVCMMVSLFFTANRLLLNLIKEKDWDIKQKNVYVPKLAAKKPLSPFWFALFLPLWVAILFIADDWTLPLIALGVIAVCVALYSYFRFVTQYADKSKLSEFLESNSRSRRGFEIFLLLTGVSIQLVLIVLALTGAGYIARSGYTDAVFYICFAAIFFFVIYFAFKSRR